MEVKFHLDASIGTKYKEEEIISIIENLTRTFDYNFIQKYFCNNINFEKFNKFVYLLDAVQNLRQSEGFEEHIKEYMNDFDSTFFVTLIANNIKQSGYDVALEPIIDGIDKKPDLSFSFNGSTVYVECKNPKQNLREYMNTELHNRVFDEIIKYIKKPCDLCVEYINEKSLDNINEVAKYIPQNLSDIKDEGVIYFHDGLKISVTNIRDYPIQRSEISFTWMARDYYSNGLFPMEIICKNNFSIGFIKKGIDDIRKKIVDGQLKRAAKKVCSDQSLIVAIDGNALLGNKTDNELYISSLFKPDKFTTFSGVLILHSSFGVENPPQLKSQYISNPYAKNPVKNISNEFRLKIFRGSD